MFCCFTENENSTSIWLDEAIKMMINLYEENAPKIGSKTYRLKTNKKMWELIQERLRNRHFSIRK